MCMPASRLDWRTGVVRSVKRAQFPSPVHPLGAFTATPTNHRRLLTRGHREHPARPPDSDAGQHHDAAPKTSASIPSSAVEALAACPGEVNPGRAGSSLEVAGGRERSPRERPGHCPSWG